MISTLFRTLRSLLRRRRPDGVVDLDRYRLTRRPKTLDGKIVRRWRGGLR